MALKGNLRDFSITQLLNLINLAHKSGTLIIEGAQQSIWISFRQGKLAYAQIGQEDNSLATVLYRANRLTAAQHRVIKTRAGNMSDKELGLLLINANYLTQQEILTALQNHFVGIVNQVFNRVEGIFHFENNVMPPDDKITVRVNLEDLIIEGTRRLQEWEHLQEEIPSLDMALRFVERPGANLRNINLSVDEWKVVSYINPKNTMRQIADATRLNELEIRRIIYGLLQAGLVEIVRPAGVRPFVSPDHPSLPQQTRAEKKSLINRIIDRIRSL